MLAEIADNTTAVWDWAPPERPFVAASSLAADRIPPATSTTTARGPS